MTVTREEVRKLIVTRVASVAEQQGMRLQAPGLARPDISTTKEPYVRLEIIYLDGFATGMGLASKDRMVGNILTEVNYKEGAYKDLVACNKFLDAMQALISNRDLMFPVRTYSSKQHSPQDGVASGWVREALLTPFWYDT